MLRYTVVAVTALTLAALIAPATAAAFPLPVDPQSQAVPGGFVLSPRAAVALASQTEAVKRERAKGPLAPAAAFDVRGHIWTISFKRGDRTIVEAQIDDAKRTVGRVYSGAQAATALARGEHGPARQRLHLLMLVAGIAFFLPFFDPRRPFRMLHLDLLVMLGLGIHHYFFARGDLDAAMPVVYPVLVYLMARVLWLMFKGTPTEEPLVPLVPNRALAIALGLVVAGRVAINLFGGLGVMEGGYDSVWGADTIIGGWQLYTPAAFPLNVYGPVTYLAYVPFEAIFPIGPGLQHGQLEAAHAAAIAFDLATVSGLLVLGRRLRAGSAGTSLGLALAFAWASYPWTVAVAAVSTNDALVPALLVWALVLIRSRPARGALLGLATAAKFYPLPIIPAFARAEGERYSVRGLAGYAAVVIVVIVLAIAPYIPHPGGVDQFLDLTVNAQVSRSSFASLWGLHPSLEWLQTLVRASAVCLAVALFFVPRRRTTEVLAGATAALILAQQLSLDHWYYLYASWFAPFVLIALFAPYPTRRRASHTQPAGAA